MAMAVSFEINNRPASGENQTNESQPLRLPKRIWTVEEYYQAKEFYESKGAVFNPALEFGSPAAHHVMAQMQYEALKAQTASNIASPATEPQAEANDLMTREEIAILAMTSAKTLANQRVLGPPATGGGGRKKKSTWHYLLEVPALEAKFGRSMPSLTEARQILAAKQNV